MTDESEQLEPQDDRSADQMAAYVSDSDVDRDPFEELASEFSERFRSGEMPSVEEYAEKYPDLAAEIRDLFPTIAAMEQLKERKAPSKPAVGGLELEQLGDFRILGEIGRGGMGVVYEAEQVSLGRHVAVKVLPKQALLDERHLRRFEREAQTAAKLHHTNIVPVFGVGQQDGFHYIVMQFIPGVGLDEILVSLRTLVLEENASHYRVDSSSRASHANHNAQALLDGNFSRHPTMSLASSFTKDSPTKTIRVTSKTTPVGGAAATVELPGSVVGSEAATGVLDDSLSADAIGSEASASAPKSLDEDNSRVLAALDKEYYHSVARIGQQVADALAYAHEQGTLHRDIKPGNLLLDGTGTVWVADFGLAKLAEQDAVSRTGDLVGTLSYMPPESFSGETDARGDIYALGLTMYEMLALRPAYYGRDRGKLVKKITDGDLPRLSKLNPAVPRDLETIVLKAIAHRPEDRYATARDFEEDLECFLEDMPIKARRMSLPEQFTRWCRKNQLVASLSAAVLTLLLVSSITFGFLYRQASQASAQAEQERDKATEQERIAKEQERIAKQATRAAKQTALETLDALTAIFPKERLPPSADQSLQTEDESTDATTADDLTAEADLTEDSGTSVASAQITPERAALIEQLLPFVEKLAKRADNDQDFAARFANLTIRAGKMHRMLGNHDEALKYFDDGIAKYKTIVNKSDQLPASAVIGLASSYNEKGDLLKSTSDPRNAYACFKDAQDLFEKHVELLSDSPRSKYEEARTYFLISIDYKGSRFGGGGPNGFRRGGGRRGNNPNRRPREERGRRGAPRGGDGRRGDGPRGDGSRRDGPPRDLENGPPPGPAEPPMGRGPSLRERFAFWNPRGALEKAKQLLIPLVESETNPEYRYLLARCYTSIAMNTRRDPRKRAEHQQSIQAAVDLLGDLVKDQPNVSDYEYEFAIASLELEHSSAKEELKSTEKIAKTTEKISSQNPAISSYAFLHGRALMEHTMAIMRAADETSNWKQELKLREEAKGVMERAESTWKDLRARFPDATEEFAGPMPQMSMLKELKIGIETKLAFARANALLQTGQRDEAEEILTPLRQRCIDELKRELTKRPRMGMPFWSRAKQRDKLMELIVLLCRTEQLLRDEAAGMEMLDRVIEKRRDGIEQQGFPSAKEISELLKARVLRGLGKEESAVALMESLRGKLANTLEDFEGRPTQKLMAELMIYSEVLRELDDQERIEALQEQLHKMFFDRFRRGGRSQRPNDDR